MASAPRTFSNVVCLGCGCACDDIAVTVDEGRIIEAARACPAGRAWFGDGTLPSAVLRSGQPAPFDAAIAEAAELLTATAGRLLVHIGADLSCEAQRAVLALADFLGATVDSETSETAAAGLLAAQRRGRVAATLGEIRNRADMLVFWGVDPMARYPRYLSRYALDPIGTHVPDGRQGRTVIAVSVGGARGPAGADVELALDSTEEIAALSVMRATLQGTRIDGLSPNLEAAAALVDRLAQARYVVFVHDAEPHSEPVDPLRVEALLALTQALNSRTRAALSSLRAGGNQLGAEAVLTWQTGYPFGVDYASGAPRYTPEARGLTRLAAGAFGGALVVGSTANLDTAVLGALGRVPSVVIGPRASQAALTPQVAIDTGVAGIHEAGTAYRMDEVPLPLRSLLPSPRGVVPTLAALQDAVTARPRTMAS